MEYVPLLLGLVMGVITSYTDLKTGFIDDVNVFPTLALLWKIKGADEEDAELLDKVPIPAVEGGVLYYLYRGLQQGNSLLAISGLVGFLFGLTLGVLLYYVGAWASGDAIILAGFSALLPYPSRWATFVPPYALRYPLYPVTILLNSLIAVFPFIFLYAFGVILIRGQFGELKRIFSEGAVLTFEASLWIIAALGLRLLIYNTTGILIAGIWSWTFTIVVIYLLGKFRRFGDAMGLLVLGYLIYEEPLPAVRAFFKLLVILYAFKVFFSLVRFMRRGVLMEETPAEGLNEWDILGETIFERNGEILRDREDFLTRVKKAVSSADTSLLKPHYERVIASPTAEGLKREQIEELKKLVEDGKLENRFLRKKAIPFAPALFIGFLISYFWGDLFWWIQLKLAGA